MCNSFRETFVALYVYRFTLFAKYYFELFYFISSYLFIKICIFSQIVPIQLSQIDMNSVCTYVSKLLYVYTIVPCV